MRSLVTGAGGFLGGAIVRQLIARGHEVRGLIRRPSAELEGLGVDCRFGDIRERSDVIRACDGMDVVFHAAAMASLWGPWKHFYETNVLGTANVVHGCRDANVGRLVLTSSPSVTFAGRDQCGIDESAPYASRWLAHYPQTKALAEQMVLEANGHPGLLTCALRPHLIWGPGDQHLIPRLLDRARKGQLRQVGDGTNLIDATFIENAAEAHLQAASALVPGSSTCGKAYFISNGEPINCWKWINEILIRAGLAPARKRVPLSVAYAAGTLLEAAWTILGRRDEPRMTRFLAAQLGTSHYFDISAARRDLGYAPAVSMSEGMQRLADWLRSNHSAGS